jgi:hypothetical protein
MTLYTLMIALVALMLTGCDSDEDGPRAVDRDTCSEMCAHLGCDADITPEQVGACADRCVDKQDEVDDHGAACTDAYIRSVECFAGLECTQYLAWEAGDEEICGEALMGFEQSCTGVAFDFSGGG